MIQEGHVPAHVQRSSGINVELRQGMNVVLQFSRDGKKYSSKIVGTDPYNFIITKMPLAPGISKMLFPGEGITLKYECDGIIYGFDTEIVNFVLKPVPLLLLAYPVSTEKIELRRHKRLSCLIPVHVENEYECNLAFMVDISQGGCRLVMDRNDSEQALNVMTGDKVTIHPVVDLFGADTVRAIIANAAQRDRKIIFGTAFEIDDPELSKRIIEFIARITDILKEQKKT
ncbi:MAG: flagellar brake domain-containing protein [Thermodesulfobacteriota bacterium]